MHQDNIGPFTFIAKGPLRTDHPSLVLIHGSGQCARIWQRQVEGITWGGNIVALDLPGHGGSTEGGMDRMEDYARWVMAFIDRAGLQRVMPGGLSLGGAVVLQMLIQEPQRFAGALLMNTGARLRVAAEFFDVLRSDLAAWCDLYYRYSTHDANRSPALRRIFDQTSTGFADITLGDFAACDRFDVMAALTDIACPVLVLSAQHDQLTPVKYGQFLAEQIQHARHTTIPGAGHFSLVERPEEVNRAIEAFLNQYAPA